MGKIKTAKILFLIGILSLGMVAVGFAQESEEADFAFGKVVRISPREVVIALFDFEQAKDIEEAFIISDESVFDGYDSAADVRVGDDVDIEYEEVGGKKTVQYLYRSEDEEIGEGDEQEELLDEVDSFIEDKEMQVFEEDYKDVE